MKQYILPAEGKFYKANLHCHTTNSDGKFSPEEVKSIYKSAGYSIVAYSDHNVLVDNTYLNDEDFLAFTAVEIDVNKKIEGEPWVCCPCYHINFYPEDPHNVKIPCYNPKHVWGKRPDLRDAQEYVGTPDYERDYEKINEMIAEFAKNGFIAHLNHPSWSLQNMDEYRTLDTTHIFAMEVYNHACMIMGYNDVNEHIYDQLLRRGDKLFCTATDDSHHTNPEVYPKCDSLGGFVMIKAPDLSHKSIYEALKAGNFYASNAPEIHELYIEDNFLCVKTSPAVKITMTCAHRQAGIAYPKSFSAPLTEAKFDLSKILPGYVRITVYDEKGRKAWSQPIWSDFSEAK